VVWALPISGRRVCIGDLMKQINLRWFLKWWFGMIGVTLVVWAIADSRKPAVVEYLSKPFHVPSRDSLCFPESRQVAILRGALTSMQTTMRRDAQRGSWGDVQDSPFAGAYAIASAALAQTGEPAIPGTAR
jgi:hypothetical protein